GSFDPVTRSVAHVPVQVSGCSGPGSPINLLAASNSSSRPSMALGSISSRAFSPSSLAQCCATSVSNPNRNSRIASWPPWTNSIGTRSSILGPTSSTKPPDVAFERRHLAEHEIDLPLSDQTHHPVDAVGGGAELIAPVQQREMAPGGQGRGDDGRQAPQSAGPIAGGGRRLGRNQRRRECPAG